MKRLNGTSRRRSFRPATDSEKPASRPARGIVKNPLSGRGVGPYQRPAPQRPSRGQPASPSATNWLRNDALTELVRPQPPPTLADYIREHKEPVEKLFTQLEVKLADGVESVHMLREMAEELAREIKLIKTGSQFTQPHESAAVLRSIRERVLARIRNFCPEIELLVCEHNHRWDARCEYCEAGVPMMDSSTTQHQANVILCKLRAGMWQGKNPNLAYVGASITGGTLDKIVHAQNNGGRVSPPGHGPDEESQFEPETPMDTDTSEEGVAEEAERTDQGEEKLESLDEVGEPPDGPEEAKDGDDNDV